MTKRKIEPALQVAGAVQNATTIIAERVAVLGGNYTEALVRIGMGEKKHCAEIDQIATVYASVSNSLVAPDGGKIHVLRDIVVDESVEWNAAINTRCPDTPANYDVRKVAGSYPAKVGSGVKPVVRNVVLVNFGKGIPDTKPALAWGRENKLPIASPRAVFAVVEKHPTLHRELEMDPMVIVSLEECSFSGDRRVPYAWLCDGERKANLHWPDSSLSADCWFAFVRE